MADKEMRERIENQVSFVAEDPNMAQLVVEAIISIIEAEAQARAKEAVKTVRTRILGLTKVLPDLNQLPGADKRHQHHIGYNEAIADVYELLAERGEDGK